MSTFVLNSKVYNSIDHLVNLGGYLKLTIFKLFHYKFDINNKYDCCCYEYINIHLSIYFLSRFLSCSNKIYFNSI